VNIVIATCNEYFGDFLLFEAFEVNLIEKLNILLILSDSVFKLKIVVGQFEFCLDDLSESLKRTDCLFFLHPLVPLVI
jgi:hypothetical protein